MTAMDAAKVGSARKQEPRESDPLIAAQKKPRARISPIVERHEHALVQLLRQLSPDAWVLIASKSVRMFSYGFLAVILVIYLQTMRFSDDSIGLLFTLTLVGDAALSILLTSHADRWGRKFTLMLGSAVAIVTSLVFATTSRFPVLLLAGVLGVISPSGGEIGPFMAIELSALTEVCLPAQRTRLMAWYNLFGSVASACGALTCGLLVDFLAGPRCGYSLRKACSLVLILYAFVQAAQMACFSCLSAAVEVQPDEAPPLSAGSGGFLGLRTLQAQWTVAKLSLLFMLDAFAGAFVLQSFISSWFFARFGTPASTLGSIVFICNVAAGVSALFAAQLAERVGLVLTMVATHLPSNVLLLLVPLMPSEAWAIVALCARFSISQMDVPARNAYVQGVVAPDERSAASGVTGVARSVGACLGPALAGALLAERATAAYPFFVAGGLKIAYDLLLLAAFRAQPSSSDVHITDPSPAQGAPAVDQA